MQKRKFILGKNLVMKEAKKFLESINPSLKDEDIDNINTFGGQFLLLCISRALDYKANRIHAVCEGFEGNPVHFHNTMEGAYKHLRKMHIDEYEQWDILRRKHGKRGSFIGSNNWQLTYDVPFKHEPYPYHIIKIELGD